MSARVAAAALAAVMLAPGSVAADEVWSGYYACPQGTSGMTVFLDRTGAQATGLLHFYPVNGADNVDEGCFRVEGVADGARIALDGVEWVTNPGGYEMVGFAGTVNGLSFEGRMAHEVCGAVALMRIERAVPRPQVCRAGGTPASLPAR